MAIRPDRPANFRVPYHVGYEVALKAAKERLILLENLEEQAWIAGAPIEQVQSNIERWMTDWNM